MTAFTNPQSTMQESIDKPKRKSSVSWIWIGLAISLPMHAILLAILSSIGVGVGTSTGKSISTIEVSLIETEPLQPSPDSSSSGTVATPEVRPAEAAANSSDSSIFGLPDPTGNDQGDEAIVSAGAEGLFASGGGGGDGGIGDGTGATTTFFGVSGRGKKIGYVVDKSGSMGIAGRMEQAKKRSSEASANFLISHRFVSHSLMRTFKPSIVRRFRQMPRGCDIKIKKWIRDVAQSGEQIPSLRLGFYSADANAQMLCFYE